jgi:hypothetical protein
VSLGSEAFSPDHSLGVRVEWMECAMSGAVPAPADGHNLLAVSIVPDGRVAASLNGVALDDGGRACQNPFLSAQGALTVNKTNAAFPGRGGGPAVYADMFGFSDLQAYAGGMSAEEVVGLWQAAFDP